MIKSIIKRLLGITNKEGLNTRAFIRCWHRRLGPFFYKRKYTPDEVISAMRRAGMKKGSTILVQSSWGEFYNCIGSPVDLIDKILKELGPEGTLCMSCMPDVKSGQIFNVATTRTKAGYLAECFRNYPGVKRSINERHSVCAIGKNADFLLSEHHLGETPWDKKSPYYRLAQVDGLVFGLGLGRYWIGTIAHCVESILKTEISYYSDMWDKQKSRYDYIDYDGKKKFYYNFSMPESGRHMRFTSYFKSRRIVKKYLHNHYQQVSNLQISCFEAEEVIRVLTGLGKKGIDIYLLPSKRGYSFEC